MRKFHITYILSFIFPILVVIFMCFLPEKAQGASRASRRTVVGKVVDSSTGEPLSHVNVYSKKAKAGTVTDALGVFKLYVPVGSEIEATSLGFQKLTHKAAASADTLMFLLEPADIELEEFVVKPKKKKYSKKNNPAVELMQRVRHEKDFHNPIREPDYTYDRYEKIVLALNDYHGFEGEAGEKSKSGMKFVRNLVDTAIWTGKRVLDISLKEKFATRLFSDGGHVKKDVTVAQHSNGIDKAFDQDFTRTIIEDALREVDVYDNDIYVMRSKFVSPLSPLAADYYKFHIEDTVQIGNERCVELSFAPHNAESQGFNGKLYIPADDSVKYVRRLTMRMPKATNLNYVQSIMISQNFMLDSIGKSHKVLDDMIVELKIIPGTPSFSATRQTRYDNFSYEKREDLSDYYDKIGSVFVVDEAEERDQDFWTPRRFVPLSYAESQLAGDQSPFRQNKLLYWGEQALILIVKGYIKTGKKSKFDIGPIDTFLSYNKPEGWRIGVGGMTTANLNPHWFARGYVAYGTRDHKWKYGGEVEYSFNAKKYHTREFPMNGIRLSYSYDVDKLGQHYLTNSASNLLNSIKRRESDMFTYRELAQIEYNKEWHNNLSLLAGFRYDRQEATPFVSFTNGLGQSIPNYSNSVLKLQLRYAPGERYVQTNSRRLNVNRDALTLLLTHEFGPKGLLGADFTFNATEFCVQKRFWLSAFGYTDIIARAGKIWSKVQFPALFWQNANLAYTMQSETYALLNPMEFAMDQYASLDFTYFLNGLIFNRIPFINKAKLREVISFKGFVGHLSRKNNPEYNEDLFRFPEGAHTEPMGRKPYMEIGVGLDNIFTILRLDYVWRLTYRDRPGIDKSGLRFSLHFNF